MLAGKRTAIVQNQVIYRFHCRQNLAPVGFVLKLHQRNNVEVAIAHVSGYGRKQFVSLDYPPEAGQKCSQMGRRNYKVVDKRRRMLIFDLASEQLETIAAHYPEFL